VYWLALLLSTGQPWPDAIFVHEYLTVDGVKLSKSSGTPVDPVDVVARYGSDALRWWLLSEVAALGDTDFTEDRLRTRYHQDLANGLGNLIHRTVSLIRRYRAGVFPDHLELGVELARRAPERPAVGDELVGLCAALPAGIDRCLARFDFRAATDAIRAVVGAANRLIETERPWELAGRADDRLDAVLATLVTACRALAHETTPFLPAGAARLAGRLRDGGPRPVFPRSE
jgi:methionyl-tRNA synthetase